MRWPCDSEQLPAGGLTNPHFNLLTHCFEMYRKQRLKKAGKSVWKYLQQQQRPDVSAWSPHALQTGRVLMMTNNQSAWSFDFSFFGVRADTHKHTCTSYKAMRTEAKFFFIRVWTFRECGSITTHLCGSFRADTCGRKVLCTGKKELHKPRKSVLS